MAFYLPRRLELGRMRPFSRRGSMITLISLSALLVSSADAQVSVGRHNNPAVTVDYSVLDRLGPPVASSHLSLDARNPAANKQQVAAHHRSHHSALPNHRTHTRHVAAHRNRAAGHKLAIAKAPPAHVTKAPIRTASSLNQIIHLIPPKSRLASAAPFKPGESTHQAVIHQTVAMSAPTKPSVAALIAPASTPPAKQPPRKEKLLAVAAPAQQDVTTNAPTKPSVAALAAPAPTPAPTQQARDEKPSAAGVGPQDEPVAAPSSGAGVATPSSTVPAAAPPVAMAFTAAAPTPAATVSRAVPVAVAPPVQMAAATTIGSAAIVVKFKPGVTDLGGGAQPVLDAIANRLLANQDLRVQLVSHASGAADDSMEARRVSLARAVAVRAYLIDKGVRSLRIDVRALGNRADNGPAADQVDLLVVSQ